MMIHYERLTINRSKDYFHLCQRLDEETPYMLYSPNERVYDEQGLKAMIEKMTQTGLILCAVETSSDTLIGYIAVQRSSLQKIQHIGYIVIGILEEYSGKGIGTTLFKKMEEWALAKKLHRLELTVIEENTSGIRLYQKMGFVKEGTKQKAIYMNGKYYDELYMAKIIETV